MEPPDETSKDNDEEPDQAKDQPQGAPSLLLLLLNLLLAADHLDARVEVVLNAQDPVGDNEDDHQDGHSPIWDPHGIP